MDSDKNEHSENILRLHALLSSDFQCEKIVELQLCNCKLKDLPNGLTLCVKLKTANLSNNVFQSVPSPLTCGLPILEHLDLSFNLITQFDLPLKSKTLKWLSVSHNRLDRLPKWLWNKDLTNVSLLDLSGNIKLFETLDINQIISGSISLNVLNVVDTKFKESVSKLLLTMPELRSLYLGVDEGINSNDLMEFPGEEDYWKKMHVAKLCNVGLCDLNPAICDMLYLVELDLRFNNLTWLPESFGGLTSLEICLLSNNKIILLPNTFGNLRTLRIFHISYNQLCSLPESLNGLSNLVELDVYDNEMIEFPYGGEKLLGLDLAHNHFDELNTSLYIKQKEYLRNNYNCNHRFNGRKAEFLNYLDEYSLDNECTSESNADENISNEIIREVDICDLEEEWVPEYNDDYWEPSQDDYLIPICNSYSSYSIKSKLECHLKFQFEEDQFSED